MHGPHEVRRGEGIVTRLDDPGVVAAEYASDERLRRRARAFQAGDVQRLAVEVIAEARPVRVLEVGCGWGELAARVAAETGAEVVAVDVSPRMVELARARGVDARLGDVQELAFADGAFDCAIAAWMLYHVPDLHRGLAELARVLRPGGRLVAITNSAFHLQELRDLVGSGPSPSTFTRENGCELLERHFADVRREDVDGVVEYATREDVVGYVEASIAMSPFIANVPADLPEPFVARRAVSVFVCERAP
jgi:SAM-dependent methyltransferase